MSERLLLPGKADLAPLRRTWRADLLAGVTVAVVALPLALGFGVASGVGPAAGLVTAVVAGIVAAVFGGSHVQVSGPTGAMVVVLAPIVAEHGVASVGLVAAMAGVVLVVAGYLRLGRIVGVIPWPVIEGFTLGIAVIIGAQQIPRLVDVAPTVGSNAVADAVRAVLHPGPHAAWSAAVVGAVVVIMVVGRRLAPRLPDSLLAVAVVTVVTLVTDAPVARIGALPDSLPAPQSPRPDDLALVEALLPGALAVAALAAIESLLSAKIATTMAEVGPMDPDRELVGQGLASLAAGAFGGMPATGAIARTAVNVSAGGRSRLAAVTHGVVLLGVVYVASSVVSQIPLAALSGVLLVVAGRMVDREGAHALLRAGRGAAAVFVLTAGLTIAVDLINAVAIGMVVAAVLTLRHVARASGVRRDDIPGPRHDEDEHIALVTIDGAVFFGAAERVHDDVLTVGDARVVVLRLSQLTMLDSTGARRLADLMATLHRRGVDVVLKGVRDQDRSLLERVGAIGPTTPVFTDLEQAIAAARRAVRLGDLPPQFRRGTTTDDDQSATQAATHHSTP